MIAECIIQHRKIPFNNPILNEDQRCDYYYLIYDICAFLCIENTCIIWDVKRLRIVKILFSFLPNNMSSSFIEKHLLLSHNKYLNTGTLVHCHTPDISDVQSPLLKW